MNDERKKYDDGDPVDDFFARARAEVRPEPADDLRWQRIVREAGQSRRSRWLGTVAGVAAAGVVAASLAFGPQVLDRMQGQQQGGVAVATHGQSATGAPTPSTLRSSPMSTPSSSKSSSTDSRQGTAPAVTPGTFTSGSLSNSGQQRLYLLGSSTCGGDRCPVLQTSSDNGTTWHVVHTFAPGDADLTQARFANPNVGWVYGAHTIQVTRDGGRTWRPYPFEGDRVFDLESNGKDVVVATSSRCSSGTCAGSLEVARTPISAASPSGASGLNVGLRDAQISTSETQTLIVPRHPAGSQDLSGPWWLDGQDLVNAGQMPGNKQSPSCDATDTGTMVVGANDPDLAGSLCPTSDPDVFTVDTTQGNYRWTRLGPTLRIPGQGPVSLAVASKSHLLAMRGDTLRVSTDAGLSWHEPAAPPTTPKQGWAWVGAPGGTQFYALAQGGSGYWVSGDWGEHWKQVTPEG